MHIRHWPDTERPREKLLAHGASILSDAELLAILLRTGLAGCGVLQLAHTILAQQGGLAGLLNASVRDLASIKGLGPAKQTEILAVMELARRAVAQQLQQRADLGNPELAAHYVQMHLAHKPHECFAVLFLDTQHRLICMETLFTGTLDQASVYPREVAARALLLRAASVVLAHNHPSGNPDPSAADIALTRRLQQALALLDISVLDHLIVAQGHAVSLAQRGLMPLA